MFDPGFRLSLAGGYRFTDAIAVELETGFTYASVRPFAMDQSFHSEGNTFVVDDYFRVSISDMNLWTVPFLANVVYRIPSHSRLKPYVGIGAGGLLALAPREQTIEKTVSGYMRYTLRTFRETSTTRGDYQNSGFAFAYQARAGIEYEISPRMGLGLHYCFLGTSDLNFDDIKTEPLLTHTISLSLTYRF
jgi:opacity protein-like surface antigen